MEVGSGHQGLGRGVLPALTDFIGLVVVWGVDD